MPGDERRPLADDHNRSRRSSGAHSRSDGQASPPTAGVVESGWDFPDEDGWSLGGEADRSPTSAVDTPTSATDTTSASNREHYATLLTYSPWQPDPDGQDAYLDLDESPSTAAFAGQLANVAALRWATSRSVGQADAGDIAVQPGQRVLVEGERTTAVAFVLESPVRRMTATRLPRIVRVLHDQAEPVDDRDTDWTREAHRYCRRRIEQLKLAMKLSRVESAQGGKKAIFYFSAENRIDFRELVRDLSRELRVRVELRQVGVRDEAKVTGAIGPCGRELCCSSWIAEFQPVSIRMAKDQNLVLNPAKISGMCGRLKCCLAYEQNLYREGRRRLPRVGETVSTQDGPARVLEIDVPRQLVRVVTSDGTSAVLPASAVKRAAKPGNPRAAANTAE